MQQRAVPGRVPRRRHHRQRGRDRALAVDGLDAIGLVRGQHAAAHELEALRVRLGAQPVVELGPRDVDRRVGEGERVVAVLVDQPADVVGVEVGLHDGVNLLQGDAQLGDALRQLAAARRAERATEDAVAGVDEGGAAVAADQEAAEVERHRIVRLRDPDLAHPIGRVHAGEVAREVGDVGRAVADRGDLERADADGLAEPRHGRAATPARRRCARPPRSRRGSAGSRPRRWGGCAGG